MGIYKDIAQTIETVLETEIETRISFSISVQSSRGNQSACHIPFYTHTHTLTQLEVLGLL